MLDWRLEARDAGIEFGQLLSRWGSEGQTKGKLFPAHPQEWGVGGVLQSWPPAGGLPAWPGWGLGGLPSCVRQASPALVGLCPLRRQRTEEGKGQVHGPVLLLLLQGVCAVASSGVLGRFLAEGGPVADPVPHPAYKLC